MKVGSWKFWAWAAVIGLILYFVTQRPEWSAETVHAIGYRLKDGADRIGLFLTNIFT